MKIHVVRLHNIGYLEAQCQQLRRTEGNLMTDSLFNFLNFT